MFIICAIVYLCGMLVFCIFCQSHLQQWAIVQTQKLENLDDSKAVGDSNSKMNSGETNEAFESEN